MAHMGRRIGMNVGCLGILSFGLELLKGRGSLRRWIRFILRDLVGYMDCCVVYFLYRICWQSVNFYIYCVGVESTMVVIVGERYVYVYIYICEGYWLSGKIC